MSDKVIKACIEQVEDDLWLLKGKLELLNSVSKNLKMRIRNIRRTKNE